jgi:hypothetical protein
MCLGLEPGQETTASRAQAYEEESVHSSGLAHASGWYAFDTNLKHERSQETTCDHGHKARQADKAAACGSILQKDLAVAKEAGKGFFDRFWPSHIQGNVSSKGSDHGNQVEA